LFPDGDLIAEDVWSRQSNAVTAHVRHRDGKRIVRGVIQGVNAVTTTALDGTSADAVVGAAAGEENGSGRSEDGSRFCSSRRIPGSLMIPLIWP